VRGRKSVDIIFSYSARCSDVPSARRLAAISVRGGSASAAPYAAMNASEPGRRAQHSQHFSQAPASWLRTPGPPLLLAAKNFTPASSSALQMGADVVEALRLRLGIP